MTNGNEGVGAVGYVASVSAPSCPPSVQASVRAHGSGKLLAPVAQHVQHDYTSI